MFKFDSCPIFFLPGEGGLEAGPEGGTVTALLGVLSPVFASVLAWLLSSFPTRNKNHYLSYNYFFIKKIYIFLNYQ